ncbi:copper resistance protein B [Parvularcula sp. ZS-1/3]|uniref:Copper resistance protein B n=1 Tax=Parvularcula mediterranea TaxID=2732508 RepID=A0A7Y3RMY5_9PROT|nr:copper resistance protein B [Parvularcula mediterranea]NNU17053.1 copper resistance protein B [Parvularcula mediterranea]
MRHFLNSLAVLAVTVAGSSAFAQSSSANPWDAADAVYGPDTMRKARERLLEENGRTPFGLFMLDRFEWQDTGGDGTLLWDAQAYYGGDLRKIWMKTEGDYALDEGALEEAEVQLLYSRAISPFFDLQAGIRHDIEPDGLTHLAIGIQGLAPYWFETDTAVFLSEDGDVTARIEAELEWFLTQRLILQPRIEAELSAQTIDDRELGSGLTSLSIGGRLRYEFAREFAPYIGVEHRSSFGGTADFIEAAGGDPSETLGVFGTRIWF